MDEILQEKFAQQQIELSKKIIIPKSNESFLPKEGNIFFALDIQYKDDEAHVAADIWEWPNRHQTTLAGEISASVPYIPSYFCFREGPPLLALITHIMENCNIKPDFLIIDGHGIAHPRKFGVACWLGIALNIPTIGCAKDTLVHYDSLPEKQRGEKKEVKINDEIVGYVLVTQNNTRPIFVSPGHLISLESSVDIALKLPGQYRISDPIRNADHAAREHAKNINDTTWKDLGKLSAVSPYWER